MSFTIPLAFPNSTGNASLEASYSRCTPTTLVHHTGAILAGCNDGSVYVFSEPHQEAPPRVDLTTPSPARPARTQMRSPTRLVPSDSRNTSRSSSPSIASLSPAPFHVSPRSRVVAGVTTTQAEAPKNYVDFDDEPDRLKDMLKGRAPRDKSEKDQRPSFDERRPSVASERSPAPSLDFGASTSAFSAPASPRPRLYTPLPHKNVQLKYHAIPRCIGSPVSDLLVLDSLSSFALLQENGDLSLLSLVDGMCAGTVNMDELRAKPPPLFSYACWKRLRVIHTGEESTILLAVAAVISTSTADDSERPQARLSLLELRHNTTPALADRVSELAQWTLDAFPETVDRHSAACVHYLRDDGVFVVRELRARERGETKQDENEDARSASVRMFNPLDLPNLFKRSRPAEQHGDECQRSEERVELGEEVLVGVLAPESTVCGTAALNVADGLRILAWTNEQLLIFEYATELKQLYAADARGVVSARWVEDHSYVLEYEDHFEVYHLQAVDADSNAVGDSSPPAKHNFQPQLLHRLPAADHGVFSVMSSSEILVTSGQPEEGILYALSASVSRCKRKELWHAPQPASQVPTISALLPLDIDSIVIGYSDGRLCRSTLADLCSGSAPKIKANAALPGRIAGLHVVRHPRTQEPLIVGGGDDGSIGLWSADNLILRARWTIFLTPLAHVVQLPDVKGTPLRGCALCVAVDGTIAVVAVDSLEMVYMIPGSVATLRKICLQGNNLMLLYVDGRARVWDTATRELWRTVGQDKALEMLQHGGWTEFPLTKANCIPDLALKGTTHPYAPSDIGAVLHLDLQRYVAEASAITKAISTNRAQTRAILDTMDRLRVLLGVLITPGLNEGIDTICARRLGAPMSTAHAGLSSDGCTALYTGDNVRAPWCISPEASANRALAIVVVLRALAMFEEYADSATTVITFYATSLAACVGQAYCAPSLPFFAQRWLEGTPEVRHAVRVLFDASAVRMTDEEASSVVEHWQHQLPCLQPPPEQEATSSAMALFICGYLAAEKYAVMSTHVLTDISKSVALYLHDEHSTHRVLAIELCANGFHVWQHYVDAMEILRALFMLATSAKKDSISTQNPSAQARAAILSIASAATPLFMTTLSLDVLSPSTAEHRRSVMQVVAFLIRKRPLVLQSSLPRLMEAVVKSLDPNATASRELVLDTATEIIRQVVKTYPTVDFHGGTQRLAVGTSEGAVIMYDLKTAIRLYVLEGHKRRISACSFSPDGRRLLTLSLEESVVLVWKVGSSFSSFFSPGAPPRQGHGGSDPFKTFPFNVGEEEMTVTETFDLVKFEWTGDRSVKVRIRHSVLTLST
ncbi:WD40 repeat-like protein [Schizophyllum commune Loenen D]|nr:WD40 repeat-like protein [Schizophyllum commune Loenen D]